MDAIFSQALPETKGKKSRLNPRKTWTGQRKKGETYGQKGKTKAARVILN